MQPQFSLLTPTVKSTNTTVPADGQITPVDQPTDSGKPKTSFASVLAEKPLAENKGALETLTEDNTATPDPATPNADADQVLEGEEKAEATQDNDIDQPPVRPPLAPSGLAQDAPDTVPSDQPEATTPVTQPATRTLPEDGPVTILQGTHYVAATPLAETPVARAASIPAPLWQTAVLSVETTVTPPARPTALTATAAVALSIPGPAAAKSGPIEGAVKDVAANAPVLAPQISGPKITPQITHGATLQRIPTAEAPTTQRADPAQPRQMRDPAPLPTAGAAQTTARPDAAAPTAAAVSAPFASTRDPALRRTADPRDIDRTPVRIETPAVAVSQTSFLGTKRIAPLTPWQGKPIQVSDLPAAKELVSVDPITGESRLSSLATGTTPTAAAPTTARAELPTQIARQLAEVVQQQPNRTVEIMLKPQELGAVRLSLQQAESGIVVSLVAERPETLDLMRRNIDQLGAEFQQLGYTSIAFSFAGADADTNPDRDQGSTHDGNTPGPDDSLTPATAAETSLIHLTDNTNGGVDLRL